MSNCKDYCVALLIVFILIIAFPLNSISKAQKDFITSFMPKIKEENQKILIERKKVKLYYDHYKTNKYLNTISSLSLGTIARKYKVYELSDVCCKDYNKTINNFEILLSRIDIIPEQLVMAQAIIETGWGKSKYAKKGNNYFGMHTLSKNNGMVAKKAKHVGFAVRRYKNINASIRDYMLNINTYKAYKSLRSNRAKMRKSNSKIDPHLLAEGLTLYSAKGYEYVKIIKSIISKFISHAEINQFITSN